VSVHDEAIEAAARDEAGEVAGIAAGRDSLIFDAGWKAHAEWAALPGDAERGPLEQVAARAGRIGEVGAHSRGSFEAEVTRFARALLDIECRGIPSMAKLRWVDNGEADSFIAEARAALAVRPIGDDLERALTDDEVEAERLAAVDSLYSVPQDASEVAQDHREQADPAPAETTEGDDE
jgi:hypothetical protein